MGTNYFAIQRVDAQLKREIKLAVDDADWTRVKRMIPKKIHIGKGSVGCTFLFNHNYWEYFGKNRSTVDGIESFLKSVDIEDEYGESISYEDFWKYVDSKADKKEDLEYGSVHDGLNYSNYTEFS